MGHSTQGVTCVILLPDAEGYCATVIETGMCLVAGVVLGQGCEEVSYLIGLEC